jgi:hypothetical protein
MHAAFTWENYRRSDGTLDLIAALLVLEPINAKAHHRRAAQDFLMECEELCSLRNSEAASIALANALRIVRGE